MVDMPVGHQNLGQRQPFVTQSLHDPLDITSWVDDRSLAGIFAPENRAILFKRSHRNNEIAHEHQPISRKRNYCMALPLPEAHPALKLAR